MSNEVFDFIDGQRDCRNGVEHKDGKGADYDRGYAFEYQREQIMDKATEVLS